MLFNIRPMLAAAFLAGLLAPLAVIGAPLSQVEGDIVRRDDGPKAGDTFKVGEHEHTLGEKLGTGSTGAVHDVEGHPNVVAKVFHKDKGVAPKDRIQEIKHLTTVGEHHGTAETVAGHHIVLAEKKKGKILTETDAWKNTKNADERSALKVKAEELTKERNTHHAKEHNLVHTDTHEHNVLFEENKAGIHKANFVDWGLASAAKKDKKGELHKDTTRLIEKHAKKMRNIAV